MPKLPTHTRTKTNEPPTPTPKPTATARFLSYCRPCSLPAWEEWLVVGPLVGFSIPVAGSGPPLVGSSAPSARCKEELVELRSALVDFWRPACWFQRPACLFQEAARAFLRGLLLTWRRSGSSSNSVDCPRQRATLDPLPTSFRRRWFRACPAPFSRGHVFCVSLARSFSPSAGAAERTFVRSPAPAPIPRSFTAPTARVDCLCWLPRVCFFRSLQKFLFADAHTKSPKPRRTNWAVDCPPMGLFQSVSEAGDPAQPSNNPKLRFRSNHARTDFPPPQPRFPQPAMTRGARSALFVKIFEYRPCALARQTFSAFWP